MKTTIFFIAALAPAAVQLCSAQTSTSRPGQSNWQLAPPFEARPSPFSANTPGQSAPSTITQTTPVPPQQQAPPGRESSSKTPYVEGSSWVMTFVKTKSGSSDKYLKSMIGTLKPIYEEEKRRKIILDYKILSGDTAGDRDFNIVIMVEYANRAALDGLRERTEPIINTIIGPADKRRDLAAKRLDLREILATKTMREIWLN